MQTTQLFENLLQLTHPYYVSKVQESIDEENSKRIDIFLAVDRDYRPRTRGATFLGIQAIEQRTWQHLSIFRLPCYIHLNVLKYRFKSNKTGREYTRKLPIPWSDNNSNLTSDLEEYAMQLIELHGNIANVSKQLQLSERWI